MSATADPSTKVYRSRIDLWVPVLLLLTPGIAFFAGVMLLQKGRAGDAGTLFMLGAGFLTFTAMFTWPCRYTILNDTLSIRCGILCYQVPFADIESVEPSASLRSGPALSTRRLAVKTRKRTYLISPKAREEFLVEIEKRIK